MYKVKIPKVSHLLYCDQVHKTILLLLVLQLNQHFIIHPPFFTLQTTMTNTSVASAKAMETKLLLMFQAKLYPQ